MNLRIVYVAIPFVLGTISLLLTVGYPINEQKQRALRDEIDRRRAAHRSAEDVMPPASLPGAPAYITDELDKP